MGKLANEKMRKMQCFWIFVANNAKWGDGFYTLDIQWYNAYPSLTLRSAFALPSLSLRYGYKMLGAVLAV